MSPDHEELLRKLALSDEGAAASVLGALGTSAPSGLDPKTHALVRVAALVAVESALTSYQWAIDAALAVGASEDDVVDVLTAVAPIVGLARLSSATPEVALALGYDLDPPVPI